MKKSKMLRRLAAVLLAGTMIMAMGTSAFAEEPDNNTVNVSFTKTLDMENADGASVPDVIFTYTISPGTAIPAANTAPEILSGSEATGTPTVENAVYTHEDTNNTKEVHVDFSEVTFKRPGIYRYVITENSTDNADITNDINTTRYLDVYVVNDDVNDGYKIESFALLSSDARPDKTGAYADETVKKGEGYTNTYTTYELSLEKVVDGAMGDHGKSFEFKIDFEGPANASFTYGDKTVTLNGEGMDGIGTASKTVSIKEGEKVVIKGIPSNVKYTITENIEAKEGYKTSYTVNGVKKEGTTTVEQTMGKEDNVVVCTNLKDAVTPTGIVMNIAPYVLMVAVAAVLAIVFLRKRNTFEN